QDIAGCRIIVSDILEQDDVLEKLGRLFPKNRIVDRRLKPSFGYQAVHVIVEVVGYPIEIQVRTTLQHAWADYSQTLSDILDPQIKYGGGPSTMSEGLMEYSTGIQEIEALEKSTLIAIKETDGFERLSLKQKIQSLNVIKQNIIISLTHAKGRTEGYQFGFKKGYEKGREEFDDFLN
ncbi:MAG: hypothetical protein AAB300_02360, partial [Nitrospirota bacterium]